MEFGHVDDPLKNHGTSNLASLVGKDGVDNLELIKVLVVGAGGLGCEVLKNLAYSGFKNIDVIDMDVMELTNLNRQFLFGEENIGQAKASVAASRISSMLPHIRVTPHVNRIQDMPDSFYESFHLIVCGLDSVEARRWINSKIVSLSLADSSPSGLRPLIDGGSEGLRGQVQIILPGVTACYECTLDLVSTAGDSYPLCTIASIPRLPEHCVEWAKIIKWPQVYGTMKEPNLDNEADMNWLFNEAATRARQYNIEGVTLELVYGVLKRIIPAVASTNAVIAASCSIEALKIATNMMIPVNNYFMYNGDSGVFGTAMDLQRRSDCPVCGSATRHLFLESYTEPLRSLLLRIQSELSIADSHILPSIARADGGLLYMDSPQSLRDQLSKNLEKPLADFFSEMHATEVSVSHPKLPFAIRISISKAKNV